MLVSELLSRVTKAGETYGLSSDFAEVVGNSNNGLLEIKLLQRPGFYKDCLCIGFQKPQVATQGVVLFVGNQKYPVFIPLNKNTHSGYRAERRGSSEDLGSSTIDFSDVSTWEEFDQGFIYFVLMSPAEEQWGTPSTERKLKQIAEEWVFDAVFNPSQKKLYLGDLAKKGGEKWHESHHSGNEADIYAGSTGTIEDVYSLGQIKRLLTIFKNNGVRYVFFNPKDINEYTEFSNFMNNREKGHENHFHLRF